MSLRIPVAHNYVTVPIAFMAAMQIGLFRNIGDLAYLPVATTGNLMRFVESGYDGIVGGNPGCHLILFVVDERVLR